MADILDIMFRKRFCLPFNANVSHYENGVSRLSNCSCGKYNHVSCVFQTYKTNTPFSKANILSFGFNIEHPTPNHIHAGIHAEHYAINRLKPLKKKKKLTEIHMFVIRISKHNVLQNSKPCADCIRIMQHLPQQKGYKIKYIYYSNETGNILKTNLTKLNEEEKHYSRYYKRRQRSQTCPNIQLL